MKKIYSIFLLITSIGFAQNPGDVILTEIMNNPSAVSDSTGEYVELYNTTGTSIDLLNYVITSGTQTHTIASSVIIAPNGYVVLGRNSDTNVNGNVPVDYTYSSISLSNATGSIIIESPTAVIIDQVNWDNGVTFPDPNGASMNLSTVNLDATSNDDGLNWCESTIMIPGSSDFGSPGSANETCAVQCLTQLDLSFVTCDVNTASVDTYNATINYSGMASGTTFIVSSTAGVVGGNNPTSQANGVITVTGIPEGIDITLSVNNTANGGACDLTRLIESPICIPATCANPGDIIITEIMKNPSAVNDANGEYFEVYNTTQSAIDMIGWIIKDEAEINETHTIATSFIVGPEDYAVFVIDGNTTTNGGISGGYSYDGDIDLANFNGDGITIECSGTLIDQVIFNSASFPNVFAGQSLELSAAAFNSTSNDDGTSWFPATTPYGNGDSGTPGGVNGQILSVNQSSLVSFNIFPNPTTNGLVNIISPYRQVISVEVFDVLGKKVKSETIYNNQLNITNLNSGLYLIRLTQNNNNNTVTKKLVVK